MAKKRIVTVYDDLDLFETSGVGIPAYADAVAGEYPSFIKALNNAFGKSEDFDEDEEEDEMEEEKIEVKDEPEVIEHKLPETPSEPPKMETKKEEPVKFDLEKFKADFAKDVMAEIMKKVKEDLDKTEVTKKAYESPNDDLKKDAEEELKFDKDHKAEFLQKAGKMLADTLLRR